MTEAEFAALSGGGEVWAWNAEDRLTGYIFSGDVLVIDGQPFAVCRHGRRGSAGFEEANYPASAIHRTFKAAVDAKTVRLAEALAAHIREHSARPCDCNRRFEDVEDE